MIRMDICARCRTCGKRTCRAARLVAVSWGLALKRAVLLVCVSLHVMSSARATAEPSLPVDADPRLVHLKAELDDKAPSIVREAVDAISAMRVRG
jgi:hypothetical protein